MGSTQRGPREGCGQILEVRLLLGLGLASRGHRRSACCGEGGSHKFDVALVNSAGGSIRGTDAILRSAVVRRQQAFDHPQDGRLLRTRSWRGRLGPGRVRRSDETDLIANLEAVPCHARVSVASRLKVPSLI